VGSSRGVGVEEPEDVVAELVAAKLLVFYKHRDNIKRLWNRTEPRFKKKR